MKGRTAIAWLENGTNWTCGSCFSATSTDRTGSAALITTTFGQSFDSQAYFNGDANEEYWSDSVTCHEFGHWTMASFGVSPNEGGPHWLGHAYYPGMGGSEGWAPFMSSDVRQDPIYFDKQNGVAMWWDLSMNYWVDGADSSGSSEPTAADPRGVLQRIDENMVAAMLLALSTSSSTADQSIYDALASPAMNTSPYGRGYTRHSWSLDSNGEPTSVIDTSQPAPCLADLLDALGCAGFAPATIDAVTNPATMFPYPSANPICMCTNAGQCASGDVCLLDPPNYTLARCRGGCIPASPACGAGRIV